MDEKKDFLDNEAESENNAVSDADTTNNEQTSSLDAESEQALNSFLEDLSEEQDQPTVYIDNRNQVDESEPEDVSQKKTRFIQFPIIISFCIVLVMLLSFLIFKGFFNTSVVGAWAVEDTSTADEATEDEPLAVYLEFEDDGTATYYIGTLKWVGSYTITEEDDAKTITIDIQDAIEASYEYTVEGNFFTGRTLTFTSSYYGSQVSLYSTSVKLPELKASESFENNEQLTGTWEDMSDYGLSYEFRDDGTVSYTTSDVLFLDGVYTYDDSVIYITYYTTEETVMELEYSFDDDVLVIGGLGYEKVSAADD